MRVINNVIFTVRQFFLKLIIRQMCRQVACQTPAATNDLAGNKRNTFILIDCRVSQFETADRLTLNADTENFALYTRFNFFEVVRLAQNRVDTLAVTSARIDSVDGNVLKTIARPDVHDARLSGLFGKIIADSYTSFVVFNPKFASFFIGRRQRQRPPPSIFSLLLQT